MLCKVHVSLHGQSSLHCWHISANKGAINDHRLAAKSGQLAYGSGRLGIFLWSDHIAIANLAEALALKLISKLTPIKIAPRTIFYREEDGANVLDLSILRRVFVLSLVDLSLIRDGSNFVIEAFACPSSTLFARVPNCSEQILSFWESLPSRTQRNIIILALVRKGGYPAV